MKKRTNNKIQTLEMEKDIERTKDISEAWLEGGKAIGEIIRPKKKHSSHLKEKLRKPPIRSLQKANLKRRHRRHSS